ASRGEYLNGIVLANALGFDFIDAADVLFFDGEGNLDAFKTQKVMSTVLKLHTHAVVPGFYGARPNGTVKTFSRGGSDISGSVVARAVDADIYENWTDVSGFLVADPRIVKNPKTIDVITYHELRELSYRGANVLHEDAIFPVRMAGIPINIRNTNRPEDPGTMILAHADKNTAAGPITGIAGKRGFSVLTIEKDMMNTQVGFGRRVLHVFENHGISFEHLPSGIDSVGVIAATEALAPKRDRVINEICRVVEPDSIQLEEGLALIAVVGRGMVNRIGTAARVFKAVAESGVNVRTIDQGSSEFNIIFSVDERDMNAVIGAVYQEFYGSDTE
ncbi:MAG: ACT domain-containing protein, partial [Clostridia bacterium]|nr:ACT domain-containing protein [Clostridia bacterium]